MLHDGVLGTPLLAQAQCAPRRGAGDARTSGTGNVLHTGAGAAYTAGASVMYSTTGGGHCL